MSNRPFAAILHRAKEPFVIIDPRAFVREATLFAAFVALSIAMTWPLLPSAAHSVTDVGVDDPLLSARFLRLVVDWFIGNKSGLFDADFFFPHPNVFGTTDPCIGVGLLVLPFRLFTDDYLLLLNIAIFLTFPLTAHATYLLARDVTGSRLAGFAAGAAFGFCLYRFHQLDHVSILQMQWLVYALVYLHRLRDAPTLRNGFWLTTFVVLTGLGSASIALYSVPVLAGVALWTLITSPRESRIRFLRAGILSALFAMLLLLPSVRAYLNASEVYGIKRAAGAANEYAARIEQFAAAPPYNKIYGSSRAKLMGRESATFLGVTVFVLCAFALVSPFRRRREAAFVTAPAISNSNSDSNSNFPAPASASPLDLDDDLTNEQPPPISASGPFHPPNSSPSDSPSSVPLWCMFSSIIFFLRSLSLFAIGTLIIYAALRSTLALAACIALIAGQLALERLRPAKPAPLTTFLRTPTGLYLMVGLFFALLTLGPDVYQSGVRIGTGLWAAFTSLPGVSSIRTPSRLFFITSLAAAVLAAVGLARLLSRASSREARTAIFSIALFGILAESWSAPLPLRRYPTLAEAPPVYRWLAAQPGRGAIVELPVEQLLERRRMYFANIHKRPTVDAESSFGLPALVWVSQQSFQNGAASLHLERLAAAGLQFAIVHKAELPRQLHERYAQILASAGARPIATIGADEVYAFAPPTSPAQPLSQTSTSARLQISPIVLGNAPLSVTVHFFSRLSVPIFEPSTRRFNLRLTIDSPNARLDKALTLFLSPPLIAPASAESVKVDLPLNLAHGTYRAKLVLADDRGDSWVGQETAFVVSDSPAWPGIERTFNAATPCDIHASLPYRLPSGAKRVLVLVANTGATPWVGPNAPEIQIAEVAPDGARAAPQAGKLPPNAPGSSVPLTLAANPNTAALDLSIRFPNAPSPACSVSVRLP